MWLHRFILLTTCSLLFLSFTHAQSDTTELQAIEYTLLDYIEGTQNGEPERLQRAFHPDLNLYTVNKDGQLQVTPGHQYIGYFEAGKKANRIGKIVSIEYQNDAAIATIEVEMPARRRLYTDYLLLLKLEGRWKIIHKSYTYRSMVSE